MDGRDDGVSRDVVLAVLTASGVGVSIGDDGKSILALDEVLEAQFLPPVVARHLVGRLAKKFGIPINHFWHPEMILSPSDSAKRSDLKIVRSEAMDIER